MQNFVPAYMKGWTYVRMYPVPTGLPKGVFFFAWACENCRTYINSLPTHSMKFAVFFNICGPFPSQNKKNWKCLLTSTNVPALCLDFDEVSAILEALHIRALLSRSSREMKFDSSSWYVKAGLLRFWDNVRVFLQTTHFVKSRAHSPRPTSKIIAMIALRRAILMKADPVVSLHAHHLFSGRACSCKKDPCSPYGRFPQNQNFLDA